MTLKSKSSLTIWSGCFCVDSDGVRKRGHRPPWQRIYKHCKMAYWVAMLLFVLPSLRRNSSKSRRNA